MTRQSRPFCRVALRPVLFMAFVAACLVPAGAATAFPWDARDVAASDAYRSAERERADRYRARIRSAPPADREAVQESRRAPEGSVQESHRAPERSPSRTGDGVVSQLFSRVAGAVFDEFDRDAIEAAARRVQTSWRWWQTEGSPRASRAWAWIADVTGAGVE